MVAEFIALLLQIGLTGLYSPQHLLFFFLQPPEVTLLLLMQKCLEILEFRLDVLPLNLYHILESGMNGQNVEHIKGSSLDAKMNKMWLIEKWNIT
jgi:hypothetical protein